MSASGPIALSALLLDSLARITPLPAAGLGGDTSLVDLGLDSLRFSEVVMEVEKNAGVRFSEGQLQRFGAVGTLGELEVLIQECLREPRPAATGGDDLLSLFKAAVAGAPDRVVTTIEERGGVCHDLSLGRIADAAAGYADAFTRHGVGKGDRVLMVLPTCADFLFAFWGCHLIGAIPVPVYPPSPGKRMHSGLERLKGVMERAQPTVLVTQQPVADLLRAQAVPTPAIVAQPTQGCDRAALLSASGPGPDDIALLQFTSGSTLSPRGCVLSHRAVCANVHAAIERFEIDADDVGVSWLPLYHDMGLMSGVLAPVIARAKVILSSPDRFVMDPLWWLDAIHRHKATLTAAPNFALALVLRKLEGLSATYDLSSVRKIVNGAEPIAAQVVWRFLDRLAPWGLRSEAMEPAWGLAENTVFVTSASGGMRVDRIGRDLLEREGRATQVTSAGAVSEIVCLGRPFPGAVLRITGPDGSALPERSTGEIEMQSPSMMTGYFEDPDGTAAVFRDGWLRTGDVGYMADGELYLVGRSKDLIIVGGRNIAPQDIECASATVEGVREGSVVALGCLSQSGTEELVVVAELSPGHAASLCALEIKHACSEQLNIVPQVVQMVRPGTIPKTSSGKLQRGVTRQMYLRGELTARLAVDRPAGVAK
jgi:acyl-CoA synthetase (AMP-forming)/AMP-acid ligase II